MKSSRIKFMFIASLFALALLLGACGSNNNNEAANDNNENNNSNNNNNSEEVDAGPSSDVEQELVFGTITEAIGLSTIGTWDGASALVNRQMYEGLYERDAKTREIVPLLAESHETPDDTTWIFKLKEGIEFHDGTPFNAEAVKYTFEQLVDPDVAAPAAHLLAFMESIEVVDEYTVQLNTKEPSPNTLPVLSSEALSIVSPEADQNQNLMQEPVGTGPFKFESWVQGDRITMVKNEDYWGEPAHLEKVTYVTVPDPSTAVSMLEAGELDLIQSSEPGLIPRLEAMADVEMYQEEGSPGYYFSFNTQKEPMNEVEFRKAVAMGIDVESFIDTLSGTGFKSVGLFGPGVLDYDESIEDHGYEYNPEEAAKIIEENGYGDYELTIYSTDQGGYRRQAEIAQAELSEIGLNVKMEMMEWGTLLESTANGDHDMFVLGSSNSMTGLETMYGYFHTDSVGANNRTQHSDEEFDKLVDEARNTIDDDARQVLINEAHEMIVDEVFMVNMYHGINTLAHHESVKGILLPPTNTFVLREAYRE